MQPIIYKINLDLHETNSQYILKLTYGDVGSEIRATFNEAGKVYSLDNCICKFSMLKGDGNYIYNDCTINTEDNYISYIITNQATAACGVAKCQLILIGNDGKIKATPKFEIIVKDRIYNEQQIIASTSEFNTITSLQASVSANTSDILSLQNDVSNNSSNISSLQSAVSTNSSNISTLQTNVSSNSNAISSLQSSVSDLEEDKADWTEVYTMEEADDYFMMKSQYHWGTGLATNYDNVYGTTIYVDMSAGGINSPDQNGSSLKLVGSYQLFGNYCTMNGYVSGIAFNQTCIFSLPVACATNATFKILAYSQASSVPYYVYSTTDRSKVTINPVNNSSITGGDSLYFNITYKYQ